MASGQIVFHDMAQLELTTSLATIATTTASPANHSMLVKIVVCNFTAQDRGYDLKVRPSGDGTANKHFWRGSKTAGAGKLAGGTTETWEHVSGPEESVIFEGAAEVNNAISVTITRTEIED